MLADILLLNLQICTMMNKGREWSFVLDGLLQCRVNLDEGLRKEVSNWNAHSADAGFKFELQYSGDGFSLLPDAELIDTQKGSLDLSAKLTELFESLHQLLEPFKPYWQCTIRSVEYKQDICNMTVYGFAESVHCMTEDRSCETYAAKSQPRYMFYLLIAAAVLIIGFTILQPWILSEKIIQNAEIDNNLYQNYINFEVSELRRDGVLLSVLRENRYDVFMNRTQHPLPSSIEELTLQQNLLSGWVRILVQDFDGALLFSDEVYIIDQESIFLPLQAKEVRIRIE
jgi:hypothetical protein